MDAYPREAWLRLGEHLKQRRPQIDPRYRIRKIFAEENGLTDKTVQEIENAYRNTFSPVMLSTIEAAYRLPMGNIVRFFDGEELDPLPPASRTSQIKLSAPTSPEDAAPSVTISSGTSPPLTVIVNKDELDANPRDTEIGELRDQFERVVWSFADRPIGVRVAAIIGYRRGLEAIGRPPPTNDARAVAEPKRPPRGA